MPYYRALIQLRALRRKRFLRTSSRDNPSQVNSNVERRNTLKMAAKKREQQVNSIKVDS